MVLIEPARRKSVFKPSGVKISVQVSPLSVVPFIEPAENFNFLLTSRISVPIIPSFAIVIIPSLVKSYSNPLIAPRELRKTCGLIIPLTSIALAARA